MASRCKRGGAEVGIVVVVFSSVRKICNDSSSDIFATVQL